jgi:flagellar biosynthesis/type III secretory pathway M-ring protein FliF/YscJ
MQGDPSHFLPNSLEGWLNVLARLVATVVIAWGMLWAVVRSRIKEERTEREAALAKECEERKLADGRIEERVADVATIMQTYVGRFELLRDQIHEDKMTQIREMGELRSEVRAGFGRLEGLLRGYRAEDKQKEKDR